METCLPTATDRIGTGVRGLDTILGGGLVRGGDLVLGMPGAGKTILGNPLCFHHAPTGGRALYATLLAESHTRLMGNLLTFECIAPALGPSAVAYLSAYSVLEEGGLDALLELIRKEVRSHAASGLAVPTRPARRGRRGKKSVKKGRGK